VTERPSRGHAYLRMSHNFRGREFGMRSAECTSQSVYVISCWNTQDSHLCGPFWRSAHTLMSEKHFSYALSDMTHSWQWGYGNRSKTGCLQQLYRILDVRRAQKHTLRETEGHTREEAELCEMQTSSLGPSVFARPISRGEGCEECYVDKVFSAPCAPP
ncbi:hypothetical protein IRJ41_019030, partial [Triplophysa rosa]